MLVIISDLHFMDETAGRHNPSSAAFEHVFFPHLLSLIRAKGVHELKLLLLGDVFEYIRTEHWLETPPEDRPWGANGVADVESPRESGATEEWCLRIMGRMPSDGLKSSVPADTILSRNWESLRFIREIAPRLHEALGYEIPVKTIYMPGNHDRLCNLYPRLRDEVRDILGVTIDRDSVDGDPEGEWWYRTEYLDEEYGVFARHGQEFDLWSYGGGNDFTRRGHLAVPIGDLLGVEFATKLPYRLSLYRDESPAITDQLIDFMKEMGLVRPFTHAMQWLYFAMKNQDHGEVRDILDRIFDETVREVLDMRFVQTWRTPNTKLDDVIRLASSRWLRWIPNALLAKLSAEEILPFFTGVGHNPTVPLQDMNLIGAYHEKIWRENDRVQFILYGHTHMPVQRPLDGEEGHEVLYINTGTWRDSIFRTTVHDKDPDFMKLTQITYTAFYRADENIDEKGSDAVSFETWSGMKKAMRRKR
jgi:UDP-2,3-diacylglucosamine pyrophosphatase LpxH